jgi:hypothetical protein
MPDMNRSYDGVSENKSNHPNIDVIQEDEQV